MKHEEPLLQEYLLFLVLNMHKHLVLIIILLETVSLKGKCLIGILIVVFEGLVKSRGLVHGP